jgi:hypothetical protein
MKRLLALLVSLPLALMTQAALAERIAIIAGEQTPVSNLTLTEAQQLFSGQLRSVDGHAVEALDLPGDDKLRHAFYQQLLGRNADQMRAHWARLIFTGKAKPPREVAHGDEMRAQVTRSNNMIGYLPADKVPADAKVLLIIN